MFGKVFYRNSVSALICSTTLAARNVQKSFISNCADPSISKPKPSPLTSVKGQVVLITGASAGIGSACAWRFAAEGSKLVLIGRRENRLKDLQSELLKEYPSLKVHIVAMSVSDISAVESLPSSLPIEYQNVDILVNNAGLARGVTSVDENNLVDAVEVMNTNVLGTIAFCRAFLPGMKARGRGHIVNMGSVAGHFAYANGSVYNASKYAILGFTSAARHDLVATPIRVTHISPGMVGETEFSNVRLRDDKSAVAVYQNILALKPDDVADNVLYAVTRPRHVQIAEVMMYATNQSGPRDVARVGDSLDAPTTK